MRFGRTIALRRATTTKTWSPVAQVDHCHTCAYAALLRMDSIVAFCPNETFLPSSTEKTSTDDDVDCCDFVMTIMSARSRHRQRHHGEEISLMSDWNKIRFSKTFQKTDLVHRLERGPCDKKVDSRASQQQLLFQLGVVIVLCRKRREPPILTCRSPQLVT
jgi:hypothetical protein